MSESRDTFKYVLKNGHKIVYIGTSRNPDRRENEHKNDKKFTHMVIVGNRTTSSGAKKWEENRLKTYRKNHSGKNPKFNRSNSG